MRRGHGRGRLLLWVHLFVCLVWLHLMRTEQTPPGWMWHVFWWSVLGIQFTWGYTVGLLVGPSRRRRGMLWWSLLTIFMPLYVFSLIFHLIAHFLGLPTALVYLAVFIMILGCETFCGVLLGVKAHGGDR